MEIINRMDRDTLSDQKLKELINEFRENPDVASDVFMEITELIWDAGTCYPLFWEAVPCLIEIASGLKIEASKDLWSYLGCWISTEDKYRNGVSKEMLEHFDSSLKYAEGACIEQIARADKLDDTDAQYLYASLFAFAKHRLGYMTMGGYMDDLEGTSIAECPQGHLNDVTVYNSCIVAYEENEKPCAPNIPGPVDIGCESRENNHWKPLEEKIQMVMDNENIDKEVKAHLLLSKDILSRGVDSGLDIKYAFSVYGSLLYCNGSVDAAMRVFHGLDEITCAECGKKFVFADGWCEDKLA